ncbi:MAG: hypothetical protein Kow0047_06900 [Anaerolineae bacterium]
MGRKMRAERTAKILVVDDDRTIQTMLDYVLSAHGYTVVQASDGVEALERFAAENPDLVLLDIAMPNMDGITACERMRALPTGRDVPIIMVTALQDEGSITEAFEHGATDYITKPMNLTVLIHRIGRALQAREAEQALRESEARYRTLVERVPGAVYLASIEPNERLLYVSPQVEAITGYTPEEWSDRALWLSRIHPEDRKRIDAIPLAPSAPDRPARAEYRLIHRDGHVVWVNDEVTIVPGGRGEPGYIQGLFLDISERKRLESSMQRTLEEQKQILEAMSAVLIAIDADDRVTHWNHMAEQTFGLTSTEAVGLALSQCPIDGDVARIFEAIRQCRKEMRPISVLRMRARRAEGKPGIFNVTVTPFGIRASRDRDTGCLIIAEDITERLALEEQLSQAQKLQAIGRLAAGIAHEINTPTQYVSDNLRFLRDAFQELSAWLTKVPQVATAPIHTGGTSAGANGAEPDLEFLLSEIPAAIEQSIEGLERVNQIVRAMKEFSHPGTEGKIAVDLNRAIESTVTIARNEWKYVADVELDLASDLPLVPCLVHDLNQAILNIIVNAAHAIEDVVKGNGHGAKKGKIHISTHKDGDWVEIRISDTGTGIPEEIRDKIFEPFFTTKGVGRGTGQGLAIAHHVVVEKHGGTLTFETELGKGTTFIIRLPLVEGQ